MQTGKILAEIASPAAIGHGAGIAGSTTAAAVRTTARNWRDSKETQLARMVGVSVAGFLVLWILLFWVFRAFPYFSSGADVVYRAKLQYERSGDLFPIGTDSQRLLVFGNSRILAGFVPDEFDRLAAGDKRKIYSFNSGFPARDAFVPQLKVIADRGQAPDILLLTAVWQDTKAGIDPFNFVSSDHDFAETLFPFRYILRDFVSFVLTSRNYGGPGKFYSASRRAADHILQDRGYYFISEQRLFSDAALPRGFHVDSDRPSLVDPSRKAPPLASAELQQLREIISEHHIACYYIPYYVREGSFATPPPKDEEFTHAIEGRLDCTVLGPRYFVYPPPMFSDPTHLNPQGARFYTQAVYELLAADWNRKH